LRLGVDAGRALHGRGGVATSTRELIRALLTFASEDDIVLFDLDHGVTIPSAFERAVGPLSDRARTAPAKQSELQLLDLFHAPGFRMPPFGSPHHVFTLHDLTVISHPQCHILDNRVRTLTSVAEALARGATLHAVSEATRDEAVRLLALPAEVLEVVPPIVNPVFSAVADRAEDASRIGRLGVEEPYVLAVASLEPRKNLGRLLDAWDVLDDTRIDGHSLVVVTADGWRQGSVVRRLRTMVGDGRLVQIGRVGDGDLAALYRRATTFVLPSLAEGFGLPLVEAMASGTPVVTSRLSSMPEVTADAALLVDPEDADDIASAIERLIHDRELRRRLRELGFERSEDFTAAAVLPRMLEVYRRAVRR
jgi:glycosyltransferase involved in cell wall biosynthesis